MDFDIAMPLTLFLVTITAIFLDRRIERKLKNVFEEKEFSVRDAVLLVVAISVTVSFIVFIPQLAVMTLFLFSYSMLLFIFTYIFSDFQKSKAQLFCTGILAIAFIAATLSLFTFGADTMVAYGGLALFSLFGFAFLVLLYEESRSSAGERWYLAILPPALFICLYLFYSRTSIWFPYLLDMYGIAFAVLIILYLGSLFTWRTALIFIGLLTVMDIILVLYTGSMVSAALHVSGLRLPILVLMPTVPTVTKEWGVVLMQLGLGDFFFTGLIGIQTMKRFGKRFAIMSLIAMSVSFFIFEAFMLNYEIMAFPGTLMIVCGWIPLMLWKEAKTSKISKKSEGKTVFLAE